jgi:Glycosyl transferase family 2
VARGELIAYCDDDDALRPRHVELLVAALKANPRAGFAYTQMTADESMAKPKDETPVRDT